MASTKYINIHVFRNIEVINIYKDSKKNIMEMGSTSLYIKSYVKKHVFHLDSIKINSLCESVKKVHRKHACLKKISRLIFYIFGNEAYKFPNCKNPALKRKNESEASPIVAKILNYKQQLKNLNWRR